MKFFAAHLETMLLATLCLALLGAGRTELQCSPSPVEVLHPVQAQLERFQAGPGCAAREGGAKETHVFSIGRGNHASRNQVTIVLRPLSLSRPANWPVVLVLSSQHAVRWWLESEGLPADLPVFVQTSPNSTAESSSVVPSVEPVASLPWQPRALLRWSLEKHTTISSLTHSPRANRLMLRLGEDPTMPRVCRLQSLFLSHNYLASVLLPQKVQGCAPARGTSDPEVHVIKLWSAGSGLCGSLQVEVSVSLLPPVVNSGWHNVVLVFSSAVPVNWALTASGVRGHISVYSSNSVSPLYPPKSGLTMTSILNSNLLTTSDLLKWTNDNGFPQVTSYTEAELANRFVIRLDGGGAGGQPVSVIPGSSVTPRKESFRDWLSHEDDDDDDDDDGDDDGHDDYDNDDNDDDAEDGMKGSTEAISAECEGGQLAVAVGKQILKTVSFVVSAVTLRDPGCQAQSNSSHFLLTFPVISCGTEGIPERSSRAVRYRNTVLLWRRKPAGAPKNKTGSDLAKEWPPLAIEVSCLAVLPNLITPSESTTPQSGRVLLGRRGPRPPWVSGAQTGPPFSLQLFVSEAYEQRPVGPCVITAHNRVYVEIAAKESMRGGVEVRSCAVSPLSHPSSSPGWTVIRDGCPVDPSFILAPQRNEGEREESEDRGSEEERTKREDKKKKRGGSKERAVKYLVKPWRKEGGDDSRETGGEEPQEGRMRGGAKWLNEGRTLTRGHRKERGRRAVASEGGQSRRRAGAAKGLHRLRFSFILRPVYNNSIQFLHCSLRECNPETPAQGPLGASAPRRCPGTAQLPPLTHGPPSQQCESRNLSRPVLVTYADGMAGLLAPSAGQATRRPLKTEKTGPPRSDQLAQKRSLAQMSKNSSVHSDSAPVLVIVFAAFLMGICLMGAMWFIYSRTGKPAAARRDSLLETTEQSAGTWNLAGPLDQTNSSV